MSKEKISKSLYVSIKNGWLSGDNYKEFKTETYYKILDFFVVNTICEKLSCKGQNLKETAWGKDIWKKGELRKELLGSIDNQSQTNQPSVFFAKNYSDLTDGINNLNIGKDFYKQREEKILVYCKNNLTQIENIFYHLRNAFAHGRFNIYEHKKQRYYVFEAAQVNLSKETAKLQARIILKETTLLNWIKIINNPPQEERKSTSK